MGRGPRTLRPGLRGAQAAGGIPDVTWSVSTSSFGLCSGLLYQAGALASQLLALEAVALRSYYTLGFLQQALKNPGLGPFPDQLTSLSGVGSRPVSFDTLHWCVGQHLCSDLCLAHPDLPVQSSSGFSR